MVFGLSKAYWVWALEVVALVLPFHGYDQLWSLNDAVLSTSSLKWGVQMNGEEG